MARGTNCPVRQGMGKTVLGVLSLSLADVAVRCGARSMNETEATSYGT